MFRKHVLTLILWFFIALLLSPFAMGQESATLGTGDTVLVKVMRHERLDRVVTVDAQGIIDIPLVGLVSAEGKTTDQLAGEIRDQLSNYIKSPEVIVTKPSASDGTRRTYAGLDGGLATRVYALKYGNAVSLANSLKGVVSEMGAVHADEDTNSLIITDRSSNLSVVDNVVGQLDAYGAETSQIAIEAQFVELIDAEEERLGIRWFLNNIEKKEVGASFDKPFSLPPLPTELTLQEGSRGTVQVQNRTSIPVEGLATAATGGSFFYGELFDSYDANMVIDALSTDGKAKVLARPKIVTEDGREAKIEILTRVPFRELSRSSTAASSDLIFTTSFIDVGVVLKVTPHIKDGGAVSLQVEPEVSFVQGQVADVPVRVSRKASTWVSVKDGNTIVIGGLLQDKEIKNSHKVPILGDIPLLGKFFSSSTEQIEKTELTVFITPRILTKQGAMEITLADTKRAEEITASMMLRDEEREIAQYLDLAKAYIKAEKYSEALEMLDRLFVIDPEHREGKKLAKKAHSKLGSLS